MGLGSFWDPNDHPRGWHGRFAKKWKISDALRGILDNFRPRTFQSDSQAGQYAFNQGHKNGPFSSVELTRLRKDWDEAQDHLRAADMDPQTKAFDDMMQAHMRPTTEGLIATKTFGPDALGLRPDQMRDGPGGITDLFGTVVGDKGYSAVHLGNDVTAGQHGAGKISMTILVPPGTRAAFPGQNPQDRGFFLDKEQPLLITRVDPDGMGGWRIAAVAEPHPGVGNSQVSQELNPGRKGVGLTPEERAARLAEPSTMPTPAAPPAAPATEAVMRPESVQAPAVARTPEQEAARVARAQAGRQANVNEGNPPVQAPLPTPNPREAPAPPPAAGPASPTGVPARNEPIHSPSIGSTGTEGKSASEIANRPPEPAPEPPPVLSPSEQGKTLKDAYTESGIESPSAGPNRASFNRAYLGAKRTGGHPEQALKDLEKDIDVLEHSADSEHKAGDLKSMNDLADLIATHFGLPRGKKQEEPPKSPVQRTGGPDEFLGAPKPGAREASKVSGAPSKAQTGLTTHEQAGSGPGTAGVGGRKEGAPEAPQTRVEKNAAAAAARREGDKSGTKPTVSAARVKAGDVVLARKDENGKWVHTSRKTGATPVTVTGKQTGNGTHVIEGTDPAGNKITLEPIRGQNVLHRHQEKAPKAPAAKKAAKAAAPNPDSILRQPGQENLTDREMRAADRKRNPGAQLSEAQKADIAEKAARADARQKAAQEAPLSKARQESMPKFMQTPAGEAGAPNLEARQSADSAGVDRVLKAYNDIVARGDGHNRRVSIADIRAEVGGDLSRAEMTRALREIGRGGSTHGGLLSRGVKPDARTEASGMDMGGEKVHFLQLPRPGEAGRGGETTPHAKEAPTPEAPKKRERFSEAAAEKQFSPPASTAAAPKPEVVDATKKAYEDIVARRGPDGDRKVSLQDIRQELELQHSFSRPEVDKALRELSRGGSEHGGLISPATGKPSTREAAGAMKMGGEDVHFLQLPRPGEAARGAETTPNAPEAPAAPEVPAAAEKPLDKMTKADLLAHPDAAGAKQSWTKDKIKQHIQAKQSGGAPEAPAAATGKPSTEDRIASKLLERMTPEARDRIMADMSPAERAAVEEAQRKVSAERMVPEKVLGRKAVRPTTPIDNEPRANEFTKAWDAAGIPEPAGSAGRSMKEIRQDIADGKIDPAEGVRRMESEISFNNEELAQVRRDLRTPDLMDHQKEELQAQRAELTDAIAAQEKASRFMRAHFGGKGDKPTVAEVKTQIPGAMGEMLSKATPEDMRAAAKIQGLQEPKGDTPQEMFDDLLKQTIQQALDEKVKARTEKAAKAEAARVKKEAREAGKAEFRPGGPKHLDAAKIAEGLGLDENNSYLSDAQAELNDGKTPKQVADRIRFMARGLSDSNAIIHGSTVAGNETPDDKMNREAKLAQGREAVAKLTELADRIEASKRPRKPRAPSTKLTPTDHVAAKEAAKATGTPVAEVRSAMEDAKKADAKLQELGVPTTADELHARVIDRAAKPFNEAKTADEARRAAVSMHGNLTLADIRKMAAEQGITGRSKKDITDKMIARRFPEPSVDKPAVVREAGTPPPKFAIPRERLSGSQFKDRLKPGDQIDVHLGGGKTRRDTVESISPQGTMTTKGGYKYTTHSDVEVSKVESTAASAAPARAAKKALPQPQASPRVTLAALSNHENPPSREEAHAMIEHFTHADLQAMVKELGIPVTGSKSKENLRREIVDATVGRRLDSIATRGFRGDRPDSPDVPAKAAKAAVPAKKVAKPGPAAEPRLSPAAEKARLEQERADNMARLAAAKAVKKAAPAKAAPAKKERFTEAAAERQLGPQSGEARIEAGKFSDKPLKKQTWGGLPGPGDLFFHDSGAIGSALDSMGQDKKLDVGGEPLFNVLGQIATDVTRGTITPQQGLDRYKALAARLPSGKAKSALEYAIDQIDSPPRKPDLPDGTPAHLRKLAERLAEIPIARKDVGRTGRKGELDQVEELARKLTNGEHHSIFAVREALKKLSHNGHESASDAGHIQILAAIRDALKEDDAAIDAVRKARRAAAAGGAGPKAEGGPAARRAAVESHRRDSALQRGMKAILSRTKAGREALRKVEAGTALDNGNLEQEALRLVRGTQVRPILSIPTTSRGVSDILARESRYITGRDLEVDLSGLHVDVARGIAEGILQAQEAHPHADLLKSVHWGNSHPHGKPGWLAIAETNGTMTFRRVEDWQDMLRSYKDTQNVYGHRHGVGSTPHDIAIHEYGHMMAFGPLRSALEHEALMIVKAAHQASGSPYSLPHFVAQNISSYATEHISETLAEAYTDVMIHGRAASHLSKQLYLLILAYNPRRS